MQKPMDLEFSPQDQDTIDKLDRLARQLDSLFAIPGTSIRIGLENLVSFIPVVGDALALLPSLFILRGAHKLGARPLTILRMIGNLALDFVIGFVPLIGDIFDIAFNANLRNVALLRADLQKRYAAADQILPPALSVK